MEHTKGAWMICPAGARCRLGNPDLPDCVDDCAGVHPYDPDEGDCSCHQTCGASPDSKCRPATDVEIAAARLRGEI